MKKTRIFVVTMGLLFTAGCGGASGAARVVPADVPGAAAVEAVEPVGNIPSQPVESAGVDSSSGSLATVDCPAENFVEVQADPQNGSYPAPELNAYCQDGWVVVETNDIPDFEFVPTTPNPLQAQAYTFRFPQDPQIAAETTDVPLVGPIGVSVNGLAIFGPTEAPNDGSRDPYLDGILDYCNGHTAHGGVYHFHARPDCTFADLDGQVGLVIGYAFDGFPILAPTICADEGCTSVREVQSSWTVVDPSAANAWERHGYVEGLSELDECNGMTLSDGSYVYFATDTFPYFIGCYRGVVAGDNLVGGGQAGGGALPGGQAQGQPGGSGPGGQTGPGGGPGNPPPSGQGGQPPRP